MEPQRYAVIDSETNTVFNVIMLQSADEYGWHESHTNSFVIQSDEASPGDLYDGVNFTKPQ